MGGGVVGCKRGAVVDDGAFVTRDRPPAPPTGTLVKDERQLGRSSGARADRARLGGGASAAAGYHTAPWCQRWSRRHPQPTAELLAAADDDTRLTRSELTQPDELRVQVQLVAVGGDQSEGLWGGWVGGGSTRDFNWQLTVVTVSMWELQWKQCLCGWCGLNSVSVDVAVDTATRWMLLMKRCQCEGKSEDSVCQYGCCSVNSIIGNVAVATGSQF